MQLVGRVESLWRYPVKSMCGEELQQAFAGFSGIYGDRFFAFTSAAAHKGFPYLTARDKASMLQYRPAYRNAGRMMRPPNLTEAEALPPGVTPLYPDASDLLVDVATPQAGQHLAVDDPALLQMLREGLDSRHELQLVTSQRALTDCRPISLISLQTTRQLSDELGIELGQRRFRANLYVRLESGEGFLEDQFVGRRIQIGPKAVVMVTDRDPRCKMITLDPDSGEANPEVMKLVARAHEGRAGVYGAMMKEGTIHAGDEITLLE